MENLILQTITAGYKTTSIIKDISLTVGEETLVLMGKSGAGKTTLLKTILGVLIPQKGRILLGNKDITHLPIQERNIGYLPQDYGLFPHLNVADNIAYGLQARSISKKEQKIIVEQLLAKVQLQGFEHKNTKNLSSGQQQRVGLARTLAIKPTLLLLDEPMSNIDQITKLEVAQELKKLFKTLHIPIIIVTHNYEDAKYLADRVGIINEGIIEQIGTFNELIERPKNQIVKRLLTPFYEH